MQVEMNTPCGEMTHSLSPCFHCAALWHQRRKWLWWSTRCNRVIALSLWSSDPCTHFYPGSGSLYSLHPLKQTLLPVEWLKLCDWRKKSLSPEDTALLFQTSAPACSHHAALMTPLPLFHMSAIMHRSLCVTSHMTINHLTSNKVLITLKHVYTHSYINGELFFVLESPLIYLINH